MSVPPISSITPAAPRREAIATVAPLAEGGTPNSFCVPCSEYKNAATIRRALKSCGDHALSTAGSSQSRRCRSGYRFDHRPACGTLGAWR